MYARKKPDLSIGAMAKKYTSVYSALGANFLIAITKFIAGSYTNSSSMISEGIHSVVDSTNQLLLLYGLKKSKKPADQKRPLGYGKELYFWAFIVSILIFSLGGGLSIYHGIAFIRHPAELKDPTINYIVLGVSLIIETISFYVAIKEFNLSRGNLHWWKAIITSKDPVTFLVLFEDAAAVLGIVIVAILMVFSHILALPVLDGVASVLVGVLLVAVSFILGRESRSLLMGEGVSPEIQKEIKDLAELDPAVLKVTRILSTYQSPEEVVLMLIIAFKDELDTADITSAVQRIRDAIKARFDHVEFVIIQPQTLEQSMAQI